MHDRLRIKFGGKFNCKWAVDSGSFGIQGFVRILFRCRGDAVASLIVGNWIFSYSASRTSGFFSSTLISGLLLNLNGCWYHFLGFLSKVGFTLSCFGDLRKFFSELSGDLGGVFLGDFGARWYGGLKAGRGSDMGIGSASHDGKVVNGGMRGSDDRNDVVMQVRGCGFGEVGVGAGDGK